jgi:hypothetical protein
MTGNFCFNDELKMMAPFYSGKAIFFLREGKGFLPR